MHAHEAADLIIQAELSVYTPLSLRVSHSTPSQAVGMTTIDLSYCACEIAFAPATHLKPQPQSLRMFGSDKLFKDTAATRGAATLDVACSRC